MKITTWCLSRIVTEPLALGAGMDLNLTVSRNMNFGSNSLRGQAHYTESHPPIVVSDDVFQGRGCSVHLDKRPDDDPTSSRMSFTWTGEIDSEMKFMVGIAYRNGGVLLPEFSLYWGEDEHAYFWWHENWLYIEITGKGLRIDGPIALGSGKTCDFMSARICVGDLVNTSRFYNGHSPSKLDLSGVDMFDVWAHACSWGQEVMETLAEDNQEAQKWRQEHRAVQFISEMLMWSASDHLSPVESLHVEIESMSELSQQLVASLKWYASVVRDNFKGSELYRAADLARRDARTMSKRKVRR